VSFCQVGTSLGATRGLLLRGGDVLEKFSDVDAVVFDKTGTLTIGRPVITKVIPSRGMGDANTKLSLLCTPVLYVVLYYTRFEF
jgi:cation transport ATPase